MMYSYDSEADAAYLYFREDGEVISTHCCDIEGGIINLDLDAEGRLVGIEFLEASHRLPEKMLNDATDLEVE